MQQPGQRYCSRLLAEFLAEHLVRLDLVAVPLYGLLRPASEATPALALLPEDAAEQAAFQRRPRDDADSVVESGGQHLQLDRPGHQVVDALLADESEESASNCGVIGLRDVPGGEVRRADIEDLA